MKILAAFLLATTLTAVKASDLTTTAHSDHLIEIAMSDPKPTDRFDTAFPPDSSQLLLRSQDRFRLVSLDKPLTAHAGMAAAPPNAHRSAT